MFVSRFDRVHRCTGVILFAGAMLPFAVSPAAADCSLNGSTITCTAPGTSGYINPAGSNLSLTVQPGASLVDNGLAAIKLRNNNVITNDGTIAAGDNAAGILINNDNTIQNNATISAGANGAGISGGNRNTVFNSGTITLGDGAGGYAIALSQNGTVFNSGTINVGQGATGIAVAANTTLPVANSVTNSGTINVGEFGFGIVVTDNHRILNSGNINGAGLSAAIFGDSNNEIVNTGRIQILVFLTGTGNTLTNRGYMVSAATDVGSAASGFIGGTLINDPAGTIAIRVDPAFNDSYQADTIIVNGGRLHSVIRPGLYNGTTTFTALGGCGCTSFTGTFDTVTTSSPFFTATADYSSGVGVDVTLIRQSFGAVPGMTPNQRAIGAVLEPGYSTGLTGDLATFYGNLLSANSLGILDQLSGAGTAAAQDGGFAAGSQFGTMMMQQGMGWLNGTPGATTFSFGGPLGYASVPKNKNQNKLATKPGYDAFAAMHPIENPVVWRAWTSGYGGARAIDGQSGTANQTSTTFGGAFGVDKQVTPDLLFGFAAGGSTSHFSVSSLSTSGHIDAGHIGAYAVQRLGSAYLAATLNYARGETSTERTIIGVGPTENASGRFASDQLSGRIELGRKYGFNGYSVTPFVAIEPAALWQRAYAESSTTIGGAPGVLGLSYNSNVTTSLPVLLGAQVDASYALNNGRMFAPYARLSWVHEFKPERSIEASFIAIPGAAFSAEGARAVSDAARIEAGATLSLSRSAALFASLSSELSDRSQSIAAQGGVRMNW